jgi:polysaccharide export outer membrane protein
MALLVAGSGCTINRDIMFKTATDHTYDTYDDSVSNIVRIQPSDMVTFRLFANDGFRLIDLVNEGSTRETQLLNRVNFSYLVEVDGTVKLPLVGPIKVTGLTIREAEHMLEERFTEFYNRPFVQMQVVNRRVVVFPGGGGDARVVNLENNNTTLIEVLATAGGVNKRGDARRVKLFRVDPETRQRKTYLFDMSTIDGLKYGDVVVQGDDVIYVQPTPELAREVLRDFTPIVSLLTSVLLVVGIVRGFN